MSFINSTETHLYFKEIKLYKHNFIYILNYTFIYYFTYILIFILCIYLTSEFADYNK